MTKLTIMWLVDKTEYSTDKYSMEVEPSAELLREIANKCQVEVEDFTEDEITDYYERDNPWDHNLDPDDTDYHDSDTGDICRTLTGVSGFIEASLDLVKELYTHEILEQQGQLALQFIEINNQRKGESNG